RPRARPRRPPCRPARPGAAARSADRADGPARGGLALRRRAARLCVFLRTGRQERRYQMLPRRADARDTPRLPMGKKTELMQLPTRMLAVELGSQKRWRKVVLFGGIGAVAIAGLSYAVVRAADSRSAAALEGAWTDLNACLLGPPL